jgi:hypothetical protein
VNRSVEQKQLANQPCFSCMQPRSWSGPRLFRVVLELRLRRQYLESRYEHLRRLEERRRAWRGHVVIGTRESSGLVLDLQDDMEKIMLDVRAADLRFLANLE